MSDFMKWLYANYIKPQLEKVPQGEYEMDLALLKDGLERPDRESYKKAMEFVAIQAFLLGMRTGEGLATSRQ